MYVNWLLQFIWIVFVQGPLIVIKVLNGLIKTALGSNLYDSFFGTGTTPGPQSALLTYAFFATISVVLLATFFLIKLIMIFGSNKINLKYKIISLSKDAGKFFVIIVLFPLFFMAFMLVLGSIGVAIFGISSNNGGFSFELSSSISGYYLSAEYFNADNFSLNDSGIGKLSTVNFFVQIAASLTGSIIMIWFFCSYIVKIIEIFILFLAFPIGESIAIGEGDIKRKKWINEILNKSLMLIATIMFYFLFITLLKAGSKIAILNPDAGGITSKKPIINFLFLFIGSWSVIALNWFFTRKIREHNGILQSLNSIKQTGLFIKSLQTSNAKQLREIKMESKLSTNDKDSYASNNISALRYDLKTKVVIDKESLKSLKKTKIFKE